jgi:hypothetical protein
MAEKKLKVLDAPEKDAVAPINWFQDVTTPAGPARFWRLIPAEQYAQLKHFERARVPVRTLGDEPPVDEAARWEICLFLGRSLIHLDRVVHIYQGDVEPIKIAAWPADEILRLAREAAIFNGLRTP